MIHFILFYVTLHTCSVNIRQTFSRPTSMTLPYSEVLFSNINIVMGKFRQIYLEQIGDVSISIYVTRAHRVIHLEQIGDVSISIYVTRVHCVIHLEQIGDVSISIYVTRVHCVIHLKQIGDVSISIYFTRVHRVIHLEQIGDVSISIYVTRVHCVIGTDWRCVYIDICYTSSLRHSLGTD